MADQNICFAASKNTKLHADIMNGNRRQAKMLIKPDIFMKKFHTNAKNDMLNASKKSSNLENAWKEKIKLISQIDNRTKKI